MTMKTFLAGAAAAAGIAAFSVSAGAAPLSATEVLQQFNMVVFGNVDASSNIQGRSLIGGNLTGNSADFFVGAPGTVPASSFAALTVGGSITGNPKQVNNGGSVVAGGNVQSLNMNGGGDVTLGGVVTGTVNANGGTVTPNAAVTIPNFEADLKALSVQLRGLTGVAPTKNGNKGEFTSATPDANGVAVYNLESSFLQTINEISLSLNGASTLIINVGGDDIKNKDNFLGGPFDIAANVIWNFYEATELTIERQFFGAVLAPFANVKNTSSIEGTLVAAALDMDAQIHLQPFEGDLPAAAVPVPPALPLMTGVLALGGFLASRRRKRVA